MANPPHTNAMITIMVIQVAVVIFGPAPFDYSVGFWTEAAEEGPGRECQAGSAFSGAGLRCGKGGGGARWEWCDRDSKSQAPQAPTPSLRAIC